MYKSVATLIATNILLDFITQAIIVERNLHTYYRLATTTVKTDNDTDHYYILQCPFKSSVSIPKPKDMSICLIVGRYSDNEQKQKELLKARPRSNLNTQVDYRYLTPPKVVKLVKLKNGKPYTMLLKPVEKKKMAYKKARTEVKEPHDTSNLLIKFTLPDPKMAINQSAVLYSPPLIQKLETNDSLALSSTKEPQKLTPLVKLPMASDNETRKDSLDEKDSQIRPLKYLGVRDTLRTLQLSQRKLPHPTPTNQTHYKSQKFFADLETYKKGYRTKGFQNMYHRDELYQDHIFYDDLQQMGNYRINQKLQQKQP